MDHRSWLTAPRRGRIARLRVVNGGDGSPYDRLHRDGHRAEGNAWLTHGADGGTAPARAASARPVRT
jgi:hypothetical protein